MLINGELSLTRRAQLMDFHSQWIVDTVFRVFELCSIEEKELRQAMRLTAHEAQRLAD